MVNIVTDVPDDIYCKLPEAGFRHVLLNLVLNAAQAMGERAGSIQISAVRRDAQVQLSISDDGPGFPPQLLENGVYEYGTWRRGGNGLGLATARRFALEHGSRLELKNRPGGGACAMLKLPVEDCAEPSAKAATHKTTSLKRGLQRLLSSFDACVHHQATSGMLVVYLLAGSCGLTWLAWISRSDATGRRRPGR